MHCIGDIIDSVISVEDSAFRFFSNLALTESDPDLVILLEQLTQEKLEHLESLKSIGFEEIQFCPLPAVHLPLRLNISLENNKEDRDIYDVLKKAREHLHTSYQFYKRLSACTPSANLKGIFCNLANIELALKNRLDRFISN